MTPDKIECVFPMVVVSILPHAEVGLNYQLAHFTNSIELDFKCIFRHIWSMVMLTKKDSLTKTSNGSNIGGIFIQKSQLKTSKNTKRNIKTPKKKKLNCLMLIRNTRLIFRDGPRVLGRLKMNLAGVNLYFQGNMDNIMDEIPCSTIDDEPRFREFLQNAIDEGKIKSYKV